MKKLYTAAAGLSLICLFFAAANAQKAREIGVPKNYQPLKTETSPALQTLLNEAVAAALKQAGADFKPEEIAATVIDLRAAKNEKNAKMAEVRGAEKIYPASVVKMFYMVALEQLFEESKLKPTPELERGLRDMIVDSSNEATQYILDVITDTASGGELPEKEFRLWSQKRNAVNRFYSALGYPNINVNQKTHCEDAYGREQQFRNYKGENRNMLNTTATARLMAEIVTGRIAAPERTRKMMDLMKREPFSETKDQDDQAHGFSGKALIDMNLKDAKIWSKAGWTSASRHDVAYIETADGLKFVVAVFTDNHASDRETLPRVVRKIIENLGKIQ